VADEKHRIEVEQRINRMVELMLANKWKTGRTMRELASEWGISQQRARELSAEASKIVRQELLANVSSSIVPTLKSIIRGGRHEAGPGDKIAAVQAAKVLADIAGLNQHEKEVAREEDQQAPRTITVTYHASVKPVEEKSE
jgi:hypothetical protein